MSQFKISDLPLAGLKLIERQRLVDTRGSLSRLFCAEDLAIAGWHKSVAQINYTVTKLCGTIRGLHYQIPPHAEMKMVTCLRGEIWDVAVDLRTNSSTFLQWHAQTLSSKNGDSLLIPEGFAHGFQTITDDVEMIYLHSVKYAPAAEAALCFNDPRTQILWPITITEISERDKSHPLITSEFKGVNI